LDDNPKETGLNLNGFSGLDENQNGCDPEDVELKKSKLEASVFDVTVVDKESIL
jgi:hypothetical protein